MSEEIHGRIKDGIVEIVKSLALDGLAGGVHSQIFPDHANVVFPCVVVSIEGEAERLAGGDTDLQFNEYPTRVFILDRVQIQVRHDVEKKYLRWRRAILDAFNQRLINDAGLKIPGVPEAFRVDVRPATIFDPKLPQYQFVVSGCTVLVETSEPRRKRR